MIRIGLEKEFFALNDQNEVVLVPETIPHDDCGWLAEARGDPQKDIVEAVFSLRASCYRLDKLLETHNANNHPENSLIHFSDVPLMRVYKETRIAAQRRNDKGKIKYNNLYGHAAHRNTLSESTAGIHVSFTNAKRQVIKDTTFEYNGNFDWPHVFRTLDKTFEEEIRAAKRHPGFYEMKPDGRVEYRSLPANASLDKLIEVLQKVLKSHDLTVC